MIMNKYYYMAVAAMVAFCSCNSDNKMDVIPGNGNADVFYATIEDGTRTTLGTGDDAGKVLWEFADVISINGIAYSSDSGEGTVAAQFVKQGDVSASKIDGKYKAYYPANLYGAILPSTYTYQAGKFNMPMYAESTTTTLAFKNICAVLAIKVTSADMATVKKIVVKSDKALCGPFTVSENTAVPSGSVDKFNSVLLDCGTDGVSTTAEGTVFYIAIPAQTYGYFNIYLSSDGTTFKEAMATKKVSGLGAIVRNKIFNIDYERNAVQLWTNGPLFATMNIGATTETEEGTTISDPNNVRKTGVNGIWSANWKAPEIGDLDFNNTSKVNRQYLQKNGVHGFLITGTQSGYTGNSIYLPCSTSDGDRVYANYWSTTQPSGSYGTYYRSIGYHTTQGFNYYETYAPSGANCLTRPMLVTGSAALDVFSNGGNAPENMDWSEDDGANWN